MPPEPRDASLSDDSPPEKAISASGEDDAPIIVSLVEDVEGADVQVRHGYLYGELVIFVWHTDERIQPAPMFFTAESAHSLAYAILKELRLGGDPEATRLLGD